MCDKICESGCSAVLIGAGMGNENMLTLDARTQIEQADACIGAVRLLEVCPKEKPKFAEYRSVEIIKIIKGHPEYSRWAIVLSGDVGFYSGAKALTQACKEAEIPVDIVPGIASVVISGSEAWCILGRCSSSQYPWQESEYYLCHRSSYEDISSCWTGKAERSFVNRSGNMV